MESNQRLQAPSTEALGKHQIGQATSRKVVSNNSVFRLRLKASTEKLSLTESLMIAGREFHNLGAYTSKERP